jgi:hypothetical protein
MPFRALLILPFLAWAGACGPGGADRPLDYKVARAVSDAVAVALVKGDAKNLFALLDEGFLTVVANQGELEKFLAGMNEQFGQPEEYELKHSADSRRVDGSWNRVSKVFWYSVKTTRHPKGKYFLKVEIVPSGKGGRLVTSGFGLLTFETLPRFLQ